MLHTWTRELLFHPHLHCIVTSGALSIDGARWKARTGFLFPVARMKALFRGRVLAGLERLQKDGRIAPGEDGQGQGGLARLLSGLPPPKRWVVYIEPPFGRSTHVLEYLGRYTHRVAISDARLVAVDKRGVTFRTRGADRLTLAPLEFMRRFLLHVLPRGFHKIRHFGLYSPQAVKGRLQHARILLGEGDRGQDEASGDAPATAPGEDWAALLGRLIGQDPLRCPRCGQSPMQARPLSPTTREPP